MKPDPEIDWQAKSFDELSTSELFEILKLRQDIFVVEQECAYPDIDDADLQAVHFAGYIEASLAAYVRILPKGVGSEYLSIGRVVVNPMFRGGGIGRDLMDASIRESEVRYPGEKIKIGAQSHLHDFYTSLGFVKVSEEYLEDGIPHIDMIREPG